MANVLPWLFSIQYAHICNMPASLRMHTGNNLQLKSNAGERSLDFMLNMVISVSYAPRK